MGYVLLFQSITVDVPYRSIHNWLIPLCIKRQLKSGHISEPASRCKLIWHVHVTYIVVYTGLDSLSLHLCRCIYTKQNLVLLLWYSTIVSAVSSYMCEWLVLNVIFVHTRYIYAQTDNLLQHTLFVNFHVTYILPLLFIYFFFLVVDFLTANRVKVNTKGGRYGILESCLNTSTLITSHK